MQLHKRTSSKAVKADSGQEPLAEGITSVMRLSASPGKLREQLSGFSTFASDKSPDSASALDSLKEHTYKAKRIRVRETDILAVIVNGGAANSYYLIFDVHPQTLTDDTYLNSLMKLENPIPITGAGHLYLKRSNRDEMAVLLRANSCAEGVVTIPPPVRALLAPDRATIETWRDEAGRVSLLETPRFLGALRKAVNEPNLIELRRSMLIEALHCESFDCLDFEHLRPEIAAAKERREAWLRQAAKFSGICPPHDFAPEIFALAEKILRPSNFLGSSRKYVPGIGYSVSLKGSGPVNRNSCLIGRCADGTKVFALAEGRADAPFSAVVATEATLYLSKNKEKMKDGPAGIIGGYLEAFRGCAVRANGLAKLTVGVGRDGRFSLAVYDKAGGSLEASEQAGVLAILSEHAAGCLQDGLKAAGPVIAAESIAQKMLLGRLGGEPSRDCTALIGI